jgi:hypothetical protein
MPRSVNNNQDAPLLRLPPEIRCRIWEYVLGGMTLRSATFRLNDRRFTERMVPPFSERMANISPRRTCRQIYTETALLPYKSNIFNFGTYPDFRFDLGYVKSFQRVHIEKMQIEVVTGEAMTSELPRM